MTNKKPLGAYSLLKLLKESIPDATALLFPKSYRMPAWAHSPELLVLQYYSHKAVVEGQVSVSSNYHNQLAWIQACEDLKQNGSRVYVVEPELLEALKRTDYKEDLDPGDIKWPLDAFCLTFPRGGLPTYCDGDITNVVMSRYKKIDGTYGLVIAAALESGADYNLREDLQNFDLQAMMDRQPDIEQLTSEQTDELVTIIGHDTDQLNKWKDLKVPRPKGTGI